MDLVDIGDALVSRFGTPVDHYDDIFIFGEAPQSFAFLLDRERDIVYGSGSNISGVLEPINVGSSFNQFRKIDTISGKSIINLVAGREHVLALTCYREVLTWRGNQYGQLGDGTRNNSTKPISVRFSDNVKFNSIAAGKECSWALSRNSLLFGWGREAK